MLFKLIALILAAGTTACALLVFRQERIDLAHETSAIHTRLAAHERTIWRMRLDLNRSIRVQQVAILTERYATEHGFTMVPFSRDESFRTSHVLTPNDEAPSTPKPEPVPPGQDNGRAEPLITPTSNSRTLPLQP